MRLLQLLCRRCRATFYLCKACFRGHAYCSDSCRQMSRTEQKRAANLRHRRSPEGLRDHRDRMAEHRRRRRALTATVMDQGLPCLPPLDKVGSPESAVTIRVTVAAFLAACHSLLDGAFDDPVQLFCSHCLATSRFVVPLGQSASDDLFRKRGPP